MVSVFPVPAGPITDPPLYNLRALVIVKKHLSVNYVKTSLVPLPRYS